MTTSFGVCLLVFGLTLTGVSPLQAAEPGSGGCQPVFDAAMKAMTTPNHAYSQVLRARPLSPLVTESVTVGGVMYINYNGKWRRSAMTLADMKKQREENVRNATVYSCQHVRDETVDGQSASVWKMHTVVEGMGSDSTMWISRSSQLPLRTESDMDLGDAVKQHSSTRYVYTGVSVPPGV